MFPFLNWRIERTKVIFDSPLADYKATLMDVARCNLRHMVYMAGDLQI